MTLNSNEEKKCTAERKAGKGGGSGEEKMLVIR